MPKTLIEPFRIKSIEPIRMTTREERIRLLEAAKLNVFKLRAEDVLIDWLTDSGTGAMSSKQWGAIMEGDESYAGARSYYRLEKVIQDITGMPHFVPTHQGRAAEKVLFTAACKKGDLVPNNCHFDTTRGNLEYMGVEAVDLVIAEGLQPALIYPFKGNIDIARAEALLQKEGHRIPFGMITVTNNTGGGQPVSMANIRAYSALLKKYGKPFIMDVCRFSENAMFIKMREPGYENTPIKTIVQEMFSYCDGCTMSAKKDGMVNIGGFIVLRSDEWLDAVRNGLIMMEGFPTYGGMAGRDLEALAVGLEEGMDEDYLRYRLGPRFTAMGIELQWDVDLLPLCPQLDSAAMTELQFMLFESLSNVLQHAHAQVLRIEAHSQPGNRIFVRVIDDGRGFDAESCTHKGLASLRQRATAMGAELAITSEPGTTVVEIQLTV